MLLTNNEKDAESEAIQFSKSDKRKFCKQCNQHQHIGTVCGDPYDAGFNEVLWSSKQRSCPKCKARHYISKDEESITCYRCDYQFCTFCLSECNKYHDQWYNMCLTGVVSPNKPISVYILLAPVFMLTPPISFTLSPVIAALFFSDFNCDVNGNE